MAFEESAIRTVIEILHDGERGFQSLSEQLKSPDAKQFFRKEAETRGSFAAALESALSSEMGERISEGGTATGTIHRKWGELKGTLGGSDHTLLETAEQGEDAAKDAYKKVLGMTGISDSIKSILESQQVHIIQAHNKVRAMRDSSAAA
jgi:uncharacterized protein (TIGR02284 family)